MEFGHRVLSVYFKPLLRIIEGGFEYKGKKYQWHEVIKINRHDHWYNIFCKFPPGAPSVSISLADGKTIRFYGRTLEKRGQRPAVDFLLNKSDAFEELISIFQLQRR
jgi:hypothetical protein